MSPIGMNLLRGLQHIQGVAGPERRLKRGVENGTEHPTRGAERLARNMADRPDGPLVWVHLQGASKFEQAVGLVKMLRMDRDDITALITTTDTDSSLPGEAWLIHQFAPYPVIGLISAFLDHWRPDVLLWMEDSLDITMLPEVQKRQIPCFWLDAHLSKDVQNQWRWSPSALRKVLQKFDTILADSDVSAKRIRKSGVDPQHVVTAGRLGIQGAAPACNMTERDSLADILNARPVWLALGVSKEEEEVLLHTHKMLLRKSHRLLLILEPRSEQQGAELLGKLDAEGWMAASRLRDDAPDNDVQVFVADQLGEASLWMHLAPITYAGGSLVDGAVLDPFGPAALGSAVVFGPKLAAHEGAYQQLLGASAAVAVRHADDLTKAVDRLLSPDQAAKIAMAAWDATTCDAHIADMLKEKLSDILAKWGE